MTSTKNQNKTTETTETPKAPVAPKLHAVMLLKNYRPAGDFKVLHVVDEAEEEDIILQEREPDGEYEVLNDKGKIETVASGERHKCWTGTRIMLPKAEAQRLLRNGVAEPIREIM